MRNHSRPKFVREESWRYKRVKPSWRSPRGKTSRVRRSKKGWPATVKIGYARPKSTRGLHPSGMREVTVHRPQELEQIDPKAQVARIAHTVGENKRLLILEEAERRGIHVLNPGPKKEEPTVTAPSEAKDEPATKQAADAESKPEAKKEGEGTK